MLAEQDRLVLKYLALAIERPSMRQRNRMHRMLELPWSTVSAVIVKWKWLEATAQP